ncbi:MAG: hypothetical protein B6D41_02065 [Chloroflexi bacterium UTCFX4]|jgi:predicted DNA-binding antitoxin AbrB/MazE fold protein|nr:MAG: hypothetical protein B6D41_02065 [Chloroflexi bacterium UTCFX4]
MTIKAIYSKGVLKPLEPLPLSENQTVELSLTILPETTATFSSLFGKFPQLAALTMDDFLWAEQQFSGTVEKQSRLLDTLN